MRVLMTPLYWLGRVLLWILLLPVRIWRSVAHRKELEYERQMGAFTRPAEDARDLLRRTRP